MYKIGEFHKLFTKFASVLYQIYDSRLRLEFVYADTTRPLMLQIVHTTRVLMLEIVVKACAANLYLIYFYDLKEMDDIWLENEPNLSDVQINMYYLCAPHELLMYFHKGIL